VRHVIDLDGIGVWARGLRHSDPAAAAEAAAELEELGYSALWIPDVGGPVFDAVENLLAATRRAVIATGILNLWMHAAPEAAAQFARLSDRYGPRFLMGIGVSHGPLVDRVLEPGRYGRPLAATREFLDELDAAEPPVPAGSRVLAALGPKMLELARTRSRGVHPYLVTPEHTRLARAAVGDRAAVLPEQTVILAATRDDARTVGTDWLRGYLALPNYANNLRRLGFTEDDLSSVSDRLFDALIAWGDEQAVRQRVDEHLAAGANHVCIQLVQPDRDAIPIEDLRRLATALC
jgi:probable F420-dependent oxidoreductase